MIKKTPDWFQDNLVVQIAALSALVAVSLIVKCGEVATTGAATSGALVADMGTTRVVANCIVGGAIVVSAHSMIILFRMMKSLLSLSIKRFD